MLQRKKTGKRVAPNNSKTKALTQKNVDDLQTQIPLNQEDVMLPSIKLIQKTTEGADDKTIGRLLLNGYSDEYYKNLRFYIAEVTKAYFVMSMEDGVIQVVPASANLAEHGIIGSKGKYVSKEHPDADVVFMYCYSGIAFTPSGESTPARLYLKKTNLRTAKMVNTILYTTGHRFYTITSKKQSGGRGKQVYQWYIFHMEKEDLDSKSRAEIENYLKEKKQSDEDLEQGL